MNVQIGDLIERLCYKAIEKGRRYLASSIGVAAAAIEFDTSSGRFFVIDNEWHVDILELAQWARDARADSR